MNLLGVEITRQLPIVQGKCSDMAHIIVKSSRTSPKHRDTPLEAIDKFCKTRHLSTGTMKEFVYPLLIKICFWLYRNKNGNIFNTPSKNKIYKSNKYATT